MIALNQIWNIQKGNIRFTKFFFWLCKTFFWRLMLLHEYKHVANGVGLDIYVHLQTHLHLTWTGYEKRKLSANFAENSIAWRTNVWLGAISDGPAKVRSSAVSFPCPYPCPLATCNLQPDNPDSPGTCPKHVIDKPVSAEWSRLHFLPDQRTSRPAKQWTPRRCMPMENCQSNGRLRPDTAALNCRHKSVLHFQSGPAERIPCPSSLQSDVPPHGIRIFLPIPGRNRH